MTRLRLSAFNGFFDKWRWLVYVFTFLSALGFGVVTPNLRLNKVEAQQVRDHEALVQTTEYMRVLATATCLRQEPATNNDMLDLLCDRVLHDRSVMKLP